MMAFGKLVKANLQKWPGPGWRPLVQSECRLSRYAAAGMVVRR